VRLQGIAQPVSDALDRGRGQHLLHSASIWKIASVCKIEKMRRLCSWLVSDRLFDAGRSGAVKVAARVSQVVCSNAVLHALKRWRCDTGSNKSARPSYIEKPELIQLFEKKEKAR
jgi:hypothetical protein